MFEKSNKSLHLKRVHNHLINDYSSLKFKERLEDLSLQERPTEIIFVEGNYKVKVALSHIDFTPRKKPLGHNCPIGM